VDMKKINGYPTDMNTGTGQIFIRWVGYGGTTTRTLSAQLTSLFTRIKMKINIYKHLFDNGD